MLTDGTFIFAPMGHVWLSRLERINLSTRIRSECLSSVVIPAHDTL